MPRCLRKGCGQEFVPSANTETSCSYHSGDPVRANPRISPDIVSVHDFFGHNRFSTKGSSPGRVVLMSTNPC
jgi:CHORD